MVHIQMTNDDFVRWAVADVMGEKEEEIKKRLFEKIKQDRSSVIKTISRRIYCWIVEIKADTGKDVCISCIMETSESITRTLEKALEEQFDFVP